MNLEGSPAAIRTQNVLTELSAIPSVLARPDFEILIGSLEATRWTGRRGYAIRTMVGLALVRKIAKLRTWTSTCRFVSAHAEIQDMLGCRNNVPSIDACYRFTAKLNSYAQMLQEAADMSLKYLAPDIAELAALEKIGVGGEFVQLSLGEHIKYGETPTTLREVSSHVVSFHGRANEHDVGEMDQ